MRRTLSGGHGGSSLARSSDAGNDAAAAGIPFGLDGAPCSIDDPAGVGTGTDTTPIIDSGRCERQ